MSQDILKLPLTPEQKRSLGTSCDYLDIPKENTESILAAECRSGKDAGVTLALTSDQSRLLVSVGITEKEITINKGIRPAYGSPP